MKYIIFLFVLLMSFNFLNAQKLDPIDVKIANYPKRFNTPEELAVLINRDFEGEKEKARAIYSWVAMNVKFDTKTHFAKKKRKRLKYKNKIDRAQKIRQQAVRLENKAIGQNKATAEGYATLYKRLCDLTGVYGYLIKGTAKVRLFDIGLPPRMLNHTWNVVQVEKDWFLVDATMGAGTVDQKEETYQHSFTDKYFFTSPEKFFLNHFPKEQDWLLVEKTAEDFSKLPLYYGEFLNTSFELQEPLEGVLDLKGKDSIQFKIESPVEIEKLNYMFNYDEEPTEISVKKENGVSIFYIPFIKKRRGFVTLFYNRKAILSYKIGNY